MDKIEIYTSKKKSFLLLIASIVFVALGVWLFLEADNLTGYRARSPIFTRAIGIDNHSLNSRTTVGNKNCYLYYKL